MKPTFKILGIALFLLFISLCQARLAVMSVDLGGEFMKIAIVKPGVPMEIVLNKESKRKTSTLVAFRNGERHFSSEAESTAVKFPEKAYGYLGQVLGRKFDDPQVEAYKKRFPYYNILKDEERGTVLFKIDDETIYSPEELLAMILQKAREFAVAFAEQDIKDIVITVPSFYNQAERRSVMAAANMTGLNVLQLMSDNAAVALNYGVFRRKNFNTTMQYYMFYDMGSTSTTASIVGYNMVKGKEDGRLETNPQLTIKGVGFDRTLGGLEFTLRLRKFLADAFDEQKKTPLKVGENKRSMAKLMKEAERVKKVLSANTDHTAQIEGLLDEKDFRHPVSRGELEDLCQDLLARVTKPIEDALKVSEITLPEISEVILMGGATRMPKVQELLMKYVERSELGKSINTDEAAAMGAVYQSAYLGKGFKVKKFGVREANIYPINVEFEKQKSEDSPESGKLIKRTLFGRMNPFPQKKVMTFNKHTKDFDFDVLYGSLDFLTDEERKSFGDLNLGKYSLKGVQDALIKNKEGMESKGIKAHFRMDESGLLTLDKVESVFEKNNTEEEEKSAWSKLGSAIGGLFGSTEGEKKEDTGSNEEPAPEVDAETGTTKEEPKKTESESEGETEGTKEEPASETEGKEEKKDEQKEEANKTEQAEADKTNSTEKAEEEKKKVPKVVLIKEDIATDGYALDLIDLTKEQLKISKQKLSELDKKDEEKRQLEMAKNELEAFIFDTQDKLGENELWLSCSTSEEREKLQVTFSEASDWLYEQPEDTKTKEFTDKLKTLKESLKDIMFRVYETEERPKALEALRSALNQSTVFMATVKNLSKTEEPIFTAVEMETLEKLINETTVWRDDIVKSQAKLQPHEKPVLLVEDVGMKISAIDREMRYLINKAKNFRPKAKPKEEKKETVNDTETSTEKPDETQEEKPKTEEAGTEQEESDIPKAGDTKKRRPRSKRTDDEKAGDSQTEETLELGSEDDSSKEAETEETTDEKDENDEKDKKHIEL